MTEDNKVVRLIDKLRTKALATSLRRMLARTVREMKDEGATPAEIVQVCERPLRIWTTTVRSRRETER